MIMIKCPINLSLVKYGLVLCLNVFLENIYLLVTLITLTIIWLLWK